MLFVLRPVRLLAKAFTAENSARQIAWGFALGVLVGLVPKGNLIAVVLMTVLCGLKINLGAGLVAAFLFSWIGTLTDPLTHRLGLSVLQADWLVPLWTWISNLPVVPWTSFNNTVVMGSLLLGLALVYPAFRISEPLVTRYKPRVEARLKRFKVVQLLWGAEWTERLGAQ